MNVVHEFPGFERTALLVRKGTSIRNTEYNAKGEQSHEEWLSHSTSGPNYGKNVQFFKFGTPRPGQGARFDLQQFYIQVKAGKTDIELADINFRAFSSTLKAIDRIRLQNRPVLHEARELILYVGKPGTGKTRRAYEDYPNLYELPIGNSLWFDGYAQQEVVLLDEFEGELTLNSALKILDNYYVRAVPVKGSFVWWNPKVIILTSNTHPMYWYDYAKRNDKEEALRRRFTRIVEVGASVDGGAVRGAPNETIYTQVNMKEYWPLSKDGVLPVEQCLL